MENYTALTMMGFSVEEALAGEEALQRAREAEKTTDKRVCICGHAMSRHLGNQPGQMCTANRLICPCTGERPVIETQDTRLFRMKTTGEGAQHALTRGIIVAVGKGKKVNWIIDLQCDKCQKAGVGANVVPTPVSVQGRVLRSESELDRTPWTNALLCGECRSAL